MIDEKYHPGDQSVYDTIVRMARVSALHARLSGGGNFGGSVDGDSAAAMRYRGIHSQNKPTSCWQIEKPSTSGPQPRVPEDASCSPALFIRTC